MASSSYNLQWNYDVFLCFHQEDTGKNFVDHLYAALYQRGIITYLQTETLPLGAHIALSLLEAIEKSRIAIVVFSKNFVYSSDCLDELAHIMYCRNKRGQIVIPIYYHVQRSEVREPKVEHTHFKVEPWRNALVDVASTNFGWTLGDIPESVCIKQVVDRITNKLFRNKDFVIRGTSLQDLTLRGGDSVQISTSITSSISTKLAKYDVFLSFLGEDTRFNFVDHLYSALDQQEILTYMDKEVMFSDPLRSHPTKVIKEARIYIIIFSINYASSSLCMDELVHIMSCPNEREQIVIPLYYHVDPSEFRKQSGTALTKHESIGGKRVEIWRKALSAACIIRGWVIVNLADGYEAKGIQLIVKKISNILYPDKDLIGLHTRLRDMKYGGGGMITIPPSSHEELKHLKIPLHDIILATNNFSKTNILAAGGFGKVYRGLSKQHGTIAVKQLERRRGPGGQGDHEFMMELELLSAYKHENLVSLVGYCAQDGEKILVLKLEINGSLDKHLPCKDLTWIQRLRICLDAGNGLKYIHEDVGAQHIILHRDVKSANILLDENWKAKISDFGLSKIALANVPCSVIYSQACGTLGYIDPQYRDHNHLTQKSDVYSFGVVLFEVLCSRLVNVKNHRDEFLFSAQLAQNHYEKETLEEIIDSCLRSQMNSDCLRTYSTIAYQCLKKQAEERPTMGRVVDQLEKALDHQQGTCGSWHDVYISFRHRDRECHIVDDIRIALHQEDVSTYKDDLTLSRDESIIVKAIERSRLYVIIFTKKFGVNSWYLDEVAKIIECMKEKKQFLLSVFLNVSRSDVRTQKGYFGEVMSEYDRHPRMEVWRNALVEATNAPGLEYSRFRSSADLVTKVVEEIKNGLSAQGN